MAEQGRIFLLKEEKIFYSKQMVGGSGKRCHDREAANSLNNAMNSEICVAECKSGGKKKEQYKEGLQ